MGTIIRTLQTHDLIGHDIEFGGYAADWAVYKARLDDVERLPPALAGGGFTPLALLDEQVVALVNTAWLAGAEYGERLMKGDLVPRCDD